MVKYSEVFKILVFFGGCVLRSGDVEKLDVTVAGLQAFTFSLAITFPQC